MLKQYLEKSLQKEVNLKLFSSILQTSEDFEKDYKSLIKHISDKNVLKALQTIYDKQNLQKNNNDSLNKLFNKEFFDFKKLDINKFRILNEKQKTYIFNKIYEKNKNEPNILDIMFNLYSNQSKFWNFFLSSKHKVDFYKLMDFYLKTDEKLLKKDLNIFTFSCHYALKHFDIKVLGKHSIDFVSSKSLYLNDSQEIFNIYYFSNPGNMLQDDKNFLTLMIYNHLVNKPQEQNKIIEFFDKALKVNNVAQDLETFLKSIKKSTFVPYTQNILAIAEKQKLSQNLKVKNTSKSKNTFKI